MQKRLMKLVAIMVIFAFTFSYITILSEFAGEVQAASKELLEQNEKTNQANVEFNAHLGNGNHESEYYIGEDSQLYLKISVTDGYLKNAVVEFTNANFNVQAEKVTNEYVQEAQANKILFHELENGTQTEIALPIAIQNQETVATDHFSKETKTKFTATYVNNDGKEKQVEKEILNQINWKAKDLEIEASQNISKYVPYEIGSKKGIVLQTIVKSGIVENKIAIAQTQIEIKAPKIANQVPSRVIVTANNTKAINGSKTGIEFGKENYNYDAETGTIQINTKNKENEIAWVKGQDEYAVTMVYETEEAYAQTGTEKEITIEGKANLTPYNGEAIEKDITGKVTLTEKVGELVNANIEVPSDISKAYIYANYHKVENKLETPYHITYKIGSTDLNLVDKIQVTLANSNYLQEQEGEILQNIAGLSTIKSINVDKEMFKTYLGEDGKIEIYQNGQVVGAIAKPELQEGEEEPAIYSFDTASLETTEGLSLQTSTLQKEGNLYIEVEKAIKSEIGIEKETVKVLNKMEETIEVTNQKVQTTEATETQEAKTEILQGTKQAIKAQSNLTEIVSKAELQVSTQNLSTVVTNQNVELKAILEADSLDDGLYTNPSIQIAMPAQVEKVEIQSAEILFTEELQNLKANYNPETKNIEISMKGIQTEYSIGSMVKGPTVRIIANITTKTLIPSSEENISMKVYNEEDKATIESTVPVNIIAPAGLVTIHEMQGYSEEENLVQSVTGNEKVGTLGIYDTAKTATVKGTIINNLPADATDVKILGRVPFEGNKKIDSNEELGTNLTTNMASGVTVNGIEATTYYSENAEANKDLEDANNNWTTTPTDLSKVKSYLIVANQEKVAKASSLDFSYQVTVPENLPHNKDAYTTYKAYYNSETEVGNMAEAVEAPMVGVSTQEGPELAGNLTATVAQGEKIHGGEYVRFFVEVKNTGSVEAKNVQVKVTNPEGTTFVSYDENSASFIYDFPEDEGKAGSETMHEKTIDVGNVKVGETKKVGYELKVQNYNKHKDAVYDKETGEVIEPFEEYPEFDLENVVKVVADELEEGISLPTYTIKKVPGKLYIENSTRTAEEDTRVVGDIIEVRYTVKNMEHEEVNNAIFTYNIPAGVTVQEAFMIKNMETLEQITDGITTTNEKVEAKLGNLAIAGNVRVVLRLKIAEVKAEKFSTQAEAKADNIETHYSNIRYINLAKTEVAVTQLEPEDRYVKEGKVFDLIFEITNTGKANINHLNIECEVPDLVKAVNDTKKDGKIQKYVDYIPAGGTTRVTIPVIVDLENEGQDGIEVKSKGYIIVNGEQIAQTNTVTHVIEYVKAVHDNTGTDEEEPGEDGTFKISGYVWLDNNVNGQRDEEEQTIGNVKVLLLDKATNTIVKDQTTGEEKILTTDSTGRYTFSNLNPGEYLVAFLYDSANYDITAYQKEGVPSSSNSDGIAMNINYNGEKTRGAVTNTITITNSNARDIDLGLVTAQSFDLKLDKYITKVTRVNSAETKTYNYDNKQIAKIDTLRRRLNESNIIVEYKLVVTNEGAIPGYAKKVVDYLPKDLKFSSELNTDWYVGTDGNIYSNKLANEEIKPGESKEITLVLTKQMTENNLGNSRNTAELYETYNVLGKADVDSTTGNKVQNEDDMSSADLVLSIVTGKVATYTGIVIASIAIIAFGAYEVKKHVLDKIERI